MWPIKAGNAILYDASHGPTDQITIWGKGMNEKKYREINVEAYKFNELLGTSYALDNNTIHTSPGVVQALRFGNASRNNPAYHGTASRFGFGNFAEQHISHEIGHTVQKGEWGALYLPLVGGLTNFHSIPVLNFFELNASQRGLYGGIK